MRGEAIPIGRVGGIQIRLHITWFIVALLVVWSLSASYFPHSEAGYSTGAYWAAGVIVTLLFFLSLLLHELAHALVARSRGLTVVGITLYLFGGVSEIADEETNPGDEFRVTVVGPLTSLALALVFGVLWAALGGVSALATSAVGYLAAINLFLGLFNLLPGLPLDGGRLLQAFVWHRSGDRARATHVAVTSGVIVGYLLIVGGIFYVFTGYWINGLWLIFLGWYLQSMATQEQKASQRHAIFAGLSVADMTDTHPYVVTPETSIDHVVEDVMLAHQVRAVPVVDGKRFCGLLTLHNVSRLPRSEWPATKAETAMIPSERVVTATPEEAAEAAIADMGQHDINQLPVVKDGSLFGMLSRGAILQQIEIRRQLVKPA